MALTSVTGTITAPEPETSHTEPASFDDGAAVSGSSFDVVLSPYTNTGNVNQTVSGVLVENEVNCRQNGSGDFFVDGVSQGSSVSLAPGASAELHVPITVDAIPPTPGPNVDYSFDVSVSWN